MDVMLIPEIKEISDDVVCHNPEPPSPDMVDHPPHYTKGGVECIEAIEASMTAEEFAGYLKGNVIKYMWRYRDKGKPKQDLEKAQWYLQRLEERL